jgi:hypothetical protein
MARVTIVARDERQSDLVWEAVSTVPPGIVTIEEQLGRDTFEDGRHVFVRLLTDRIVLSGWQAEQLTGSSVLVVREIAAALAKASQPHKPQVVVNASKDVAREIARVFDGAGIEVDRCH